METPFQLLPYWPSDAERRRSERNRRRFRFRRAVIRWIMRRFKLYRHA